MTDPVKPIELSYQSAGSIEPPVRNASSAMLFAIAAILVIMLPPLSLVFAVLALWQGIQAAGQASRERRSGGTMAVVAIVLSAVVLLIDALVLLAILLSVVFDS